MPEFAIQSPHTEEECLKALDDTLALGTDVLAKFEYGCSSGDHTAYAIVQAADNTEASNLIPPTLRYKATVSEVSHITAEQIRAYHGQVT